MTATLPERVASTGCTLTTLVPDARASRRARRVVYESCVRGKVDSELADDAMNMAAELVAEVVTEVVNDLATDVVEPDGEAVRLEVQARPGEVTVTVRNTAGHERTGSVHE